jgi:acetylglutamate kinase
MIDGRMIDFGHVGAVEDVNPQPVEVLLEAGFLPIVATMGITASAELLNINADSVAGRIAPAIRAETLLLVTPSGGVRRVESDETTTLDVCSSATFERGVADGWIVGGMRAKLEEAFASRVAGVPNVFVCNVADIGRSGGTRVN